MQIEMESQFATIVCKGDIYLCQIAEAYLNYFAADRAKIIQPHLQNTDIQRIVKDVLLDDGIELNKLKVEYFLTGAQSKADFLLTFGEAEKILSEKKFDQHFHFPISLSSKDNSALTNTREDVKKAILKFIGSNLSFKRTPYNLPNTPLTKKDQKKWTAKIEKLKREYLEARKKERVAKKQLDIKMEEFKLKLEPFEMTLKAAKKLLKKKLKVYEEAKEEWDFLKSNSASKKTGKKNTGN